MVPVVLGAVAVGIVSVCAIPIGCLISQKIRGKVENSQKIVGGAEIEVEDLLPTTHISSLNFDLVEVGEEPECEFGESSPSNNDQRPQNFEVRVIFSNNSSVNKSTDFGSQGYATGSGSSQQRAASGPRIKKVCRRLSLQNPAIVADRNEAANFSLLNRTSQSCETTRFEITISGIGRQKNAAHFVEFKKGVKDYTSTPKSKNSYLPENLDKSKSQEQRSSFWKRGPKIFKTTQDIEVTEIEGTFHGELPSGSRENLSGCSAGHSKDNGKSLDRGKWGLPHRFLETLKETTSFASL